MAKTHWKKLTNPNYLGAYALEDGKDIVLTIKTVREESVQGADGKREDCAVCYFEENVKPMIMNATNLKMCASLLKSPYVEEWVGKKVQIGIEKVRAFGTITDALRIRDQLPTDAVIECEGCGMPIQPDFGMSSEKLAAYTKKKYGKCLCASCAKEAANGTNAE